MCVCVLHVETIKIIIENVTEKMCFNLIQCLRFNQGTEKVSSNIFFIHLWYLFL